MSRHPIVRDLSPVKTDVSDCPVCLLGFTENEWDVRQRDHRLMARFVLTIECDNDAFHPNHEVEVSRILRQAAYRVDMGHVTSTLVDANGNTVGKFTTIAGDDTTEGGCDFDYSGWCDTHYAPCVGGKAAILAAL